MKNKISVEQRYPAMLIGFKVFRPDGTVHQGKFRFDDGNERMRFLESCRDAYVAGERVESWKIADVKERRK